MDLFESIKYTWRNYINYYVVGNEELKEILFHVFLGILMTHKGYCYIEKSEKKSMRVHLFMIQDSGTGKSELMAALTKILNEFIPEKSKIRRTVKDNEASLTGTIYRAIREEAIKERKKGLATEGDYVPMKTKDEIIIKKGMLSTLLALIWDEGSVLLKSSAYMDILTDIFQGVMDEPGHVSKGMRLDSIEYNSNTTIVAGSYMFPEFKTTMMTKGFLQRMFIFYKIFNKEEKRNIRINVNLMKTFTDINQPKKLIEGMKRFVNQIPERKDEVGQTIDYIKFNPQDVLEFDHDLEYIYKNYIEHKFVGDKQTIFETFYSRLHLLIDKIAAQRAIIYGRNEVIAEDMQYAKELGLKHIKSIDLLLEYLVGGEINTPVEERERSLIIQIKNRGGKIVQKDLMDVLLELKKMGKWDLGWNKSLELIQRMIAQKKIHCEKAEHGRNILIAQ